MDFLLARRSGVADRSLSHEASDHWANILTVAGRSRLSATSSRPSRSVSATTDCSPRAEQKKVPHHPRSLFPKANLGVRDSRISLVLWFTSLMPVRRYYLASYIPKIETYTTT